MKPILAMEDGKTSYVVSGMPQVHRPELLVDKKGRGLYAVVIGAVTIFTVVIAVLVAVFFAMKLTKDSPTDAWQTYHLPGGQSIEQKLTVTHDVIDVNVPNKMHVVYDFIHGIVVNRFVDSKTGLYGHCYARIINGSQAHEMSTDHKYQAEVNLHAPISTMSESWDLTNNKVPSYMINQQVQNMCAGVDVFWIQQYTMASKNGISKRQAHEAVECAYLVPLGAQCVPYETGNVCYDWFICLDEDNEFMGFVHDSAYYPPV